MDKLLANELFVRLLAIALAVLIYVQVVSQPGGITQRAIPNVQVKAAAVPSDLVVTHVIPAQVLVTVRGDAQAIQQLQSSAVQAVVDLQQAVSGRHDYYVQVTVPDGVQQVSVAPLQVSVELDPLVDESMPVTPRTSGRPRAGFASGQASVNPSLVVVHGPSTLVSEVSRVVASTSIAGASDTLRESLPPQPVDRSGRPVIGVEVVPATVDVTVPVARMVPTKVVPVVPQLSGTPAKGYVAGVPVVSPSTVTVLGPSAVLRGLKEVKTAPLPISGATAPVRSSALLRSPSGTLAVQPGTVEVTVPVSRTAAA